MGAPSRRAHILCAKIPRLLLFSLYLIKKSCFFSIFIGLFPINGLHTPPLLCYIVL